jgi:hypothetical protein
MWRPSRPHSPATQSMGNHLLSLRLATIVELPCKDVCGWNPVDVGVREGELVPDDELEKIGGGTRDGPLLEEPKTDGGYQLCVGILGGGGWDWCCCCCCCCPPLHT